MNCLQVNCFLLLNLTKDWLASQSTSPLHALMCPILSMFQENSCTLILSSTIKQLSESYAISEELPAKAFFSLLNLMLNFLLFVTVNGQAAPVSSDPPQDFVYFWAHLLFLGNLKDKVW